MLPLPVPGIELGQEVIQKIIPQNAADAVGIGDVPVGTQQHPAQVGVVQDKVVQVPQEGELLPCGVLRLVVLAQGRQPVRHLILQPLQKVPHVPVVDIEGAAVDIRPLGQLPHGDGLGAFFRQQLHQRQAQLLFGFSHPAVCAGLFHMGIPLFVGFLTNLFDLYFNTGIAY